MKYLTLNKLENSIAFSNSYKAKSAYLFINDWFI